MHAVPVITWSTAPAFVLPPAVTPQDVQLECIQWVAAALRVEIRARFRGPVTAQSTPPKLAT
jgi:ATP dependent DNA ligase domain